MSDPLDDFVEQQEAAQRAEVIHEMIESETHAPRLPQACLPQPFEQVKSDISAIPRYRMYSKKAILGLLMKKYKGKCNPGLLAQQIEQTGFEFND